MQKARAIMMNVPRTPLTAMEPTMAQGTAVAAFVLPGCLRMSEKERGGRTLPR